MKKDLRAPYWEGRTRNVNWHVPAVLLVLCWDDLSPVRLRSLSASDRHGSRLVRP